MKIPEPMITQEELDEYAKESELMRRQTEIINRLSDEIKNLREDNANKEKTLRQYEFSLSQLNNDLLASSDLVKVLQTKIDKLSKIQEQPTECDWHHGNAFLGRSKCIHCGKWIELPTDYNKPTFQWSTKITPKSIADETQALREDNEKLKEETKDLRKRLHLQFANMDSANEYWRKVCCYSEAEVIRLREENEKLKKEISDFT